MPTQQRWTYHTTNASAIQCLDELVMLGYQHFNSSNKLTFHQHENSYEFVYVLKGKATWEVDGTFYTTNAGDLFHTRPYEIHRGRYNVIEPCQFWWMIVALPHPSSPADSNWLLTSPEERAVILSQLETLPRKLTVGNKLEQAFASMRKTIEFRDSLTLLKMRQQVLNFLLTVVDQAVIATHKETFVDLQHLLKSKLSENWSWRPTVEEIAQTLGYSASHFHALYRSQTGLAPISSLERMRIEEASRLLQETNEKITEIASLLGYSSSQHFATTFLRYTGFTPRSWRTKNLSEEVAK